MIIALLVALFSCANSKNVIYQTEILNYHPKGGSVAPVEEIDPLSDPNVIVYVSLVNQERPYHVQCKLYKPDGELFYESSKLMTPSSTSQFIFFDTFLIMSAPLSMYPGEW